MSTSTIPVFDAAQLNRATSGDASLQTEVLALFVVEAERLLRQVEDAADPQVRGDRVKALIGLARNIGAAKLADVARAEETQIASEKPDLAALKQAVDETLAYVRRVGI